MAFAPKSGCPMCGIVTTALSTQTHTPRSPTLNAETTAPEIMWRDDNFTIYRERTYPVSSKGHLIVVFNLHVPSLYTLSSSDVPLLVSLRDISQRLLTSLLPNADRSAPPSNDLPSSSRTPSLNTKSRSKSDDLFRIGFITPPFRDNKIPVTDHLHAHAYLLPADLLGWWRGVGYSNVAWYAIDDLIAEIREETSNNRVRSGPQRQKAPRPIDTVPAAGARQGLPNGIETTEAGLAVADLEDPDRSPGIHPVHVRDSLSTIRTGNTLSVDTERLSYSQGGLLMSPGSSGSHTPTSGTATTGFASRN